MRKALISLGLCLYLGVTIYFVGSYQVVRAQNNAGVQAEKVRVLEEDIKEIKASHLGERLTRLETSMEINGKLLLSTLGASILLVLERIVGRMGKKKEEVEE